MLTHIAIKNVHTSMILGEVVNPIICFPPTLVTQQIMITCMRPSLLCLAQGKSIPSCPSPLVHSHTQTVEYHGLSGERLKCTMDSPCTSRFPLMHMFTSAQKTLLSETQTGNTVPVFIAMNRSTTNSHYFFLTHPLI